VQAILEGRLEMTAPRQRSDPDFPLRGYVRCESCGTPLTATWSKGRSAEVERKQKARVEPVGAVVAESKAAAAEAVFS